MSRIKLGLAKGYWERCLHVGLIPVEGGSPRMRSRDGKIGGLVDGGWLLTRYCQEHGLREFGSGGASLGGGSAGTSALSSQTVVDPAQVPRHSGVHPREVRASAPSAPRHYTCTRTV